MVRYRKIASATAASCPIFSVGATNLSRLQLLNRLTVRGKDLIVRIENLRMNDQTDSNRAVSIEEDNSTKNRITLNFALK